MSCALNDKRVLSAERLEYLHTILGWSDEAERDELWAHIDALTEAYRELAMLRGHALGERFQPFGTRTRDEDGWLNDSH